MNLLHIFIHLSLHISRAKCVEQFYEDVEFWKLDNYPEISTFLDCVLNSSFKDLVTKVKLPHHCEPDNQLIPAIVRRCPKLESLRLEFHSQFKCKPGRDEVLPVIRSLSSLTHLSSLSLILNDNLADEEFRSLLMVLGSSSCLKLSTLEIESLCSAGKRIVLLLILGKLYRDVDLRAYVAEWSTDAVLQSLRVPPDCVTPYCSTLQHVNLDLDCSAASLAFLLRHIPLLQTVSCARRGNLSKAVLIYRDAPNLEGTQLQSQFNELCRQAASRRPLHVPVGSPIPRPSSGIFLLKLFALFD